MKNFKKLISAVTAFAMTATMFAGLGISANAAVAVYVDENFDSYTDGEIIASAGLYEGVLEPLPDPVTIGYLTYTAGQRNNGGITCNASAAGDTDKYLVISEDGFSNANRGIGIQFAEEAGIPEYSEIEAGNQLKLSFDISANNSFTLGAWGNVTTADLTASGEEVNLSLYIDNDNSLQTLVVTKGGEIANVITKALSGTALTGMTFYNGAGTYNIDNIIVEEVAGGVNPLTVTVNDDAGNAISDADVIIGTYTAKTDSSGQATVYLPDGSYSVSAEKNAYTDTEESTKAVEMSGAENAVTLVLTEQTYTPVPTTASVSGGSVYVATGASSTAFDVTVIDQEQIEMTDGYTLSWAVYPAGTTEANEAVTIVDGVVTVADTYTSDEEIADYDVVATIGQEGSEDTIQATASIKVGTSSVLSYYADTYVMNGRSTKYTLDPMMSITGDTKIAFDLNTGYATNVEGSGHSTALFRDGTGTAFGFQYAHQAGTLTVFTASTMSDDANTSGDLGAFTDGAVIANVSTNTVYHIEASVIGEKLVVGISSDGLEPTYTSINIADFSRFARLQYVRISNYRKAVDFGISNLMTSSNVTVDPDMVDIEGDARIAKVLGQSVTKTYTAAPIVPADGEVFTWDINNDDITLTPSEDTKSVEVTVGENVEPGTYTLSVASSASAEKTTTYSIEVGGYTYIIADATGDSTTIDTSVLAAHDASTQYMITTATADGTLVSQSTVEAVSAPLVVDTTGADKVEVAPVYVFSEVGNVASGYDFGGAFADAAYNFEFTKQTTERSDILVNGILVGNNVCQDGTGRAMTDEDRTYAINDIKVEGGSIVISAVDCVAGHDATAFSMTDITAVKAPSIVNRVPKVWVTGDSLVAKYYGTESEYLGTSRSGWGQMLENFITDDYEVINLGNSGATTQSLYDTVYPTFLSQAQEGDMVVFESGYNDQGQTTPEAMQALVVEMAEGIKATGADLVYVTPNASRHDLKESVKYAGNLIAGAVASDTPYIDLSALSYGFFEDTYGVTAADSDAVVIGANYNDDGTLNGSVVMQSVTAGQEFDKDIADNIFVWNAVNGEAAMTPVTWATTIDGSIIGLNYGLDTGAPSDNGLHSSYLGAMKFAEIVAQGLADLGFDGIDKTFTWSTEDTLGNTITVQVQ